MPIYTFYNSKTKQEFDDMMTIAEMEKYVKKNKHIKQVIKGINIVKKCYLKLVRRTHRVHLPKELLRSL